jgi:chromosome segregation ATPase
MSDSPDPRENLTAALVRDYDDEQLVLWIHALQDREEELEAEVERLERYLFAARAQVNELEVQQRQADREREVFLTEVGRLAHALAAMEGQCDEARAEAERLREALARRRRYCICDCHPAARAVLEEVDRAE